MTDTVFNFIETKKAPLLHCSGMIQKPQLHSKNCTDIGHAPSMSLTDTKATSPLLGLFSELIFCTKL